MEQQVESLAVVVSAFSSGFNPHLVSNATPLVRHIASLVLPSPFIESADTSSSASSGSNLVQNTDLVSDVTLLNADQATQALHSTSGAKTSTTTPSAAGDHNSEAESSSTDTSPSGDSDTGAASTSDDGSQSDTDANDASQNATDGHSDGASSTNSGDASSEGNAAEGAAPSTDSSDSTSSDSPAFAVRYTLNSSAQWSDGTPITGSDFEYLWKQMISQSGVADPAGYEEISTMTTGESGRVITVFFSRPYAEWKSLFQYLLPSHLYRSTSSFETVMNTAVAVSGNRYTVTSVDLGLGTITLSRNDRYWGETTAQSDRIVLQTTTNPSNDAELLRSGNVAAVAVRPTATTQLALSTAPNTTVQVIPQDRYLMLNLNLASIAMQDPAQRTRILSTINRDEVAKIASGRLDATAPADARAVAGTAVPASAVNPEVPVSIADSGDTAASNADGASSSDGSSRSDGTSTDSNAASSASTALSSPDVAAAAAAKVGTNARPFRIVVAESDAQALAAARTIGDELAHAGMTAVVRTASASEIATAALPFGLADAVVQWSTGDTTAAQVASHYRCETVQRSASEPSESLRTKLTTPASSSKSSDASTSADAADSTSDSFGSSGDNSGGSADVSSSGNSAESSGDGGNGSSDSGTSDNSDAPSSDPSSEHSSDSSSDSTSTSETTDTDTTRSASELSARAANVSGLCDTQIDSTLNQWLHGSAQVTAAGQSGGIAALTDAQVEEYRNAILGRVNSLGVSLALLQDVEVAASTSNLLARRIDGALPTTGDGGIFASAFEWRTPETRSSETATTGD